MINGVLKIPNVIKTSDPASLSAPRINSDLGAGIISNNAATLTSRETRLTQSFARVSSRHLQAANPKPITSVPFRGAKVFLADASGQPLPKVMTASTGPDGSFSFRGVPIGFSFLVVAEVPTQSGKVATFRTLVRSSQLGATTEVNAASTLASTSVLDGLTRSEIGDFNASKFQSAVATLVDRLDESKLPDFSDQSSVRASVAKLSEDIAELRSLLSEVRQDIAKVQGSIDDLKAAIDKLSKTSAPSATPSAPLPQNTSTPGISTSPAPQAQKSPVPSASLVPSAAPSEAVYRVSTVAGSTEGFADGPSASAQFRFYLAPTAIAVSTRRNLIAVADPANHRIRKISLFNGEVSTLAGSGVRDQNAKDGVAGEASFYSLRGVAIDDASGQLYVNDGYKIRKVDIDTRLVSTVVTSGSAEWSGIATDQSGNVFLTQQNRIATLSSGGVVTNLAGVLGVTGLLNGSVLNARFIGPQAVAVDQSGTLYIADTGNNCIRTITSQGVVSTLAGAVIPGFKDGQGSTAQFNKPSGIAVDKQGNVYVTDRDNNAIRKITPSGMVTTLGVQVAFKELSGGAPARVSQPLGITYDGAKNLYFAEPHRVRRISIP